MPSLRIRSRFWGLTVLLIPGLLAAPQSGRLSLDDCTRLALEAPSSVTLSQLDVDIADRQKVAARSGFLPQASLGVDYTYNSPSLNDRRTFSFLPLNSIREFATLVTIAQEVDTSGRVRAEYRRARANQEIAGANLEIARRDLKRSVGAAYYGLLLARKLAEVLEERVHEATEFEARTLALSNAGEAARADVVKATAQTASFRQALAAARTAAELANQRLAAFWTDAVTLPLELIDGLDQPLPEPRVDDQPRPYLNRQEFRLFDAEERGFAADTLRARSALRPELQLAVQWGVDHESPGLSFNDRGYAAFASLRFNLFDWSRATSQIRQGKAQALQVAQTRQIATREFSLDYESALSRVRGGFELISLARIQVTAAEEDLRLSRVRYEGGEGPALEVVSAQAQLGEARSNYYAAISNYLVAKLDLEVASGR